MRQVDARWPARSRASDGTLGDAAHQARESDHNKGLAVDVSLDREHGPDLDTLAESLLSDPRTHYVIYNRRIANRRKQGGAWRTYEVKPGGNPHTRHLHLSILHEARDDAREWTLPEADGGRVAGLGSLPRLVAAWHAGTIDNVIPRELVIGPYRVRVAADALSAEGVRLPVSFQDVLGFCRLAGMLPNTRAIVDARWEQAERRPAPVMPDPGISIDEAARKYSRAVGPVTDELTAGPWEEWIVDGLTRRGEAIGYERFEAVEDERRLTTDEARNFMTWCAPVYRRAELHGETVDLLEELARGCALGGPLPAWLVEVLR